MSRRPRLHHSSLGFLPVRATLPHSASLQQIPAIDNQRVAISAFCAQHARGHRPRCIAPHCRYRQDDRDVFRYLKRQHCRRKPFVPFALQDAYADCAFGTELHHGTARSGVLIRILDTALVALSVRPSPSQLRTHSRPSAWRLGAFFHSVLLPENTGDRREVVPTRPSITFSCCCWNAHLLSAIDTTQTTAKALAISLLTSSPRAFRPAPTTPPEGVPV